MIVSSVIFYSGFKVLHVYIEMRAFLLGKYIILYQVFHVLLNTPFPTYFKIMVHRDMYGGREEGENIMRKKNMIKFTYVNIAFNNIIY